MTEELAKQLVNGSSQTSSEANLLPTLKSWSAIAIGTTALDKMLRPHPDTPEAVLEVEISTSVIGTMTESKMHTDVKNGAVAIKTHIVVRNGIDVITMEAVVATNIKKGLNMTAPIVEEVIQDFNSEAVFREIRKIGKKY